MTLCATVGTPCGCAGEGKLFAPGNLRATFDNPNYERLVNFYLGEKYTLRCAHTHAEEPRRRAHGPLSRWVGCGLYHWCA